MEGLAQQSQIDPQMVKQVAQMLASGSTEAELVQMGVPQAVIAAAREMLENERQQEMMPMGGGLAQQQGLVSQA